VLAPAAYAELAAFVWPRATLPLAGTRGIGDQMARLAALAHGRVTITELVSAQPGAVPGTGTADNCGQHAVGIRGGPVHLADAAPGRTDAVAPVCVADRSARRWRLTRAPITCTRCAAIVARRRALERWCAMVDRMALAASDPASTESAVSRPIGPDRADTTGPTPRRPATRAGRRSSRPLPARRPGVPSRRRHREGWRRVPARPYTAVPLTGTGPTAARRRPSRGYPRDPRASVGRAPPRACRAARRRELASVGLSGAGRPGLPPLTPIPALTSENGGTRSGSANGFPPPSDCPAGPFPAGEALAEPLRPAAGTTTTRHASTVRPTQAAPDRCWRTARGLDRTLEVRPMTDLTAHAFEADPAGPVPVPVTVNGAAIGDVRLLRQLSRAEQERLSADADVERRARAARLDLELRGQRRAAARRERQADEQDKRAKAEQRRARRAAGQARLGAAAPRWAERALFVLPIMFPMAVAWAGQIRFAMTVMHWPLPAAVVFAAGFELSTAYVARLDWRSRAAGDSALLFRGATWGFAAGAAVMNYWHAAGPDFAPTGEAVSYGLMSVTGVVLWELLSTYRHRTALRAEGKLPAARPRFGPARWIWFRKLTKLAWLLTLRDGYATTELAWRAAIGAVDLYGSAKAARKAIRAGRPVPRPEPLDDHEQDTEREHADRDTEADPDSAVRDVDGHSGARDDQRDATVEDLPPAMADHPERDPNVDGRHPDSAQGSESAFRDGAEPEPRSIQPDNDTSADRPGERPDSASEGALSTRMLAYARERIAQGVSVTGADLDRQFGTRDYGRKILRRLVVAQADSR
jgi:hypothetical protein